MSKLSTQKRKNVDDLMTKLGKFSVKVYLCNEDKSITEVSEGEHGHFYKNNVYLIDVKGENHRYCVQWFGTKMPGDQVSAYRKCIDIVTENILSPREITRTSVMIGHEDDTLLTFFPNGFICHNGDHVSSPIKDEAAMYRIQGPFGEKP